MFFVSNSMNLPWLSKIQKPCPLSHYSKISLMTLPSEAPAVHPPPPPINNVLSHRNTRQLNPFTPMSDQLHIFPCSLTRNITSHSVENINLVFHSSLRWKMIVVPILTASCAWWTSEWKGWTCDVSHVKIWPKGQNKVFINVKCITLFSLDILVNDLFTFTGWQHKLHPWQRTLNWETITIYLLLFILGQPWQCIFHSNVSYTIGIKSQGVVYFGV